MSKIFSVLCLFFILCSCAVSPSEPTAAPLLAGEQGDNTIAIDDMVSVSAPLDSSVDEAQPDTPIVSSDIGDEGVQSESPTEVEPPVIPSEPGIEAPEPTINLPILEPLPIVSQDSSVTVNVYGVGGEIILQNVQTLWQENMTAFDALSAVCFDGGISITAVGSGSRIYLKAIGDLEEKTNGALSGWKYTVNGEHPSKGMGVIKLSENDVLTCYYSDEP